MATRLQAGHFFGATASALDVAGFRFTEKAYEPATLPRHSHELPHLCLVVEGHHTETLGAHRLDRVPGTVIYYPADVAHAEQLDGGGRHLLVEIQPWRLASAREAGIRLDAPVALDGSAGALGGRLFAEFRRRDAATSLALEGLMLEILAAASRVREAGRPPAWLARVKEILEDCSAEPPGLDGLAGEVGVHPVHLARAFRQHERCTVGDYVRRLRIEGACRALVATDRPLVEIALDAGFADQSHFTKSFKREMGMTPSAYRKACRSASRRR